MAPRLLELVEEGFLDKPNDFGVELFGKKAIVTSFSGREEISRPFEFHLTIDAPKLDLLPKDIIGKPLALRIDRGDQPARFIHGYVSQVWIGDCTKSDEPGGLTTRSYRIRLVSWLWFMTKSSRCCVYLPDQKEKSIKDVLDLVLERTNSPKHVAALVEDSTASSLQSRKVEHCVQYRESDFNFFSRLLERHGVYYYFVHGPDGHMAYLKDSKDCFVDEGFEYVGVGGTHTANEYIYTWEHSYEFVSGKWEHTDYDYRNPSVDLRVQQDLHEQIDLPFSRQYEFHDYPNDYVSRQDGRTEAEHRMEEEELRYNTIIASSTCKSIQPGFGFRLTKHPNSPKEEGKDYLVTSVVHSATQPGATSGAGAAASYSNQFCCIPSDIQFRPSRLTPQPVVSSVQTAFVVGPENEEIWVDEFGCVKIRFHWDKDRTPNENHSCWVRVSQVHAGRGFGAMHVPRVGEEVIVSFIEGDLDRPIITGRVYNKEAMPPFKLPEEKTRSGFKSKTYKGTGFNEISIDDQPGKEQIRMHAERDMDSMVKRNHKSTINGNDSVAVGGGQSVSVGGGRSVNVSKDLEYNVGGMHQTNVKGNMGGVIQGWYSYAAQSCQLDGEDYILLTSGDSSIKLSKNGDIEIKGKFITINGETMVGVSGGMIDSTAKGTNSLNGALVEIN